ncbi:unnamed protein product [Merluccius merluccius]
MSSIASQHCTVVCPHHVRPGLSALANDFSRHPPPLFSIQFHSDSLPRLKVRKWQGRVTAIIEELWAPGKSIGYDKVLPRDVLSHRIKPQKAH